MKKNFYIFRHGETDFNVEKRWQGCSIDAKLNNKGIEQAHKLALKMQDIPLDIIYSSNLIRAKKTAEIVAEHKNVRVEYIDDLREANYGRSEERRVGKECVSPE